MQKPVAKRGKGVGDIDGCCAILKSGKNIGKKCGIPCVEDISQTNTQSKYCKKHYKIYCNT